MAQAAESVHSRTRHAAATPNRRMTSEKPVEFGHKAQICDNDDGIVLDHDVQPGNPTDAPRHLGGQLRPLRWH